MNILSLKPFFYLILCLLGAALYWGFRPKFITETIVISATGSQPAVAVDDTNFIHVVFGKNDEIYYSYSLNGGKLFVPPVKVATLPNMHLGMTRGPQIAVTHDFITVANVTKQGRIMVYQRKKQDSKWSNPINLLDTDTTALEGFIALAAGPDNTIYAAWLDLRLNRQNNVYSAYSTNGGQTWSKSKLVYASPEGKVCECCRPSIVADKKGNVYVMFRNNLAGARDMYLAQSGDGGKSFRPAQRLGLGTWLLKACPMEGGGLAINPQGQLVTVWKRRNDVFLASPGSPEVKIGEGRSCTIAPSAKGNFTVWQQNGTIKAKTTDQLIPSTIGSGTYPRAASAGKSNVVIWEENGAIVARQVL